MPNAPDWLLNMVNTSPNLVEDSPAYRSQHNKEQMDNLHKAANDALGQVQRQTDLSSMQTMQHQMGMIDAMTPHPTPLSGPDEKFFPDIPDDMHTPMTPNVPSASDFASDQPASPTETQDPATEVQRISDATGIPPQTVAAMALLGDEIGKLHDARQTLPTALDAQTQASVAQAPISPSPAAQAPMPPTLAGPPLVAPAPAPGGAPTPPPTF